MVAQVLLQIDVDHSKLKSFWKAIGNRNLEDLITLQDMVGVPPSSRSTSGRSSPADLDGVLDVIKDLRKVVPQRPRSHSVDEESSLKQVVKDLKESSFKRTGSVDDVRKKPRDDVKRGEGIWKT